jgi:CRP-like cAMP-binding protein
MSIKGIFPIHEWSFGTESILEDLPAADLARLMIRKTEHRYKRGELIFREGGYPLAIYFIVEGKAKKYKLDQSGAEQIIYIANTGELLGFHAVLSGDSYPDSAAVLEDSSIACIHRDDFLAAVDQSPLLCRRLLRTLSHEFSVLTNSLTTAVHRPARERLALQLIVVREKYKTVGATGTAVEIDLTRNDLAALTGIARENVARILAEFKEAGIVETRGRKIIVRDIRRLVGLANYH